MIPPPASRGKCSGSHPVFGSLPMNGKTPAQASSSLSPVSPFRMRTPRTPSSPSTASTVEPHTKRTFSCSVIRSTYERFARSARRVTSVTLRQIGASTSASWRAASPPPTTTTSSPRKNPPSHAAHCETPRPVRASSPGTPSRRNRAPVAMIAASASCAPPSVRMQMPPSPASRAWPGSCRMLPPAAVTASIRLTASTVPDVSPMAGSPSTASTLATWPPSRRSCSIRWTFKPSRHAWAAAIRPAMPPPITTTAFAARFRPGIASNLLPRLPTLFGTGHRRGGFRPLLRLVLGEHRLGGAGSLLAQLVPVHGAPVEGLDPRPVVAGEGGHHVAGVELVGAFRLLPVGPVVRLVQEAAEVALLVVEPPDLGDGVVGRADDAELVLDEPFHRVGAGRDVEALLGVVEIVDVALQPELHVLHRLRACLGDVHRPDQPQARRVHRPAVLGSDLVGDFPVRVERVVAEGIGGGDADHAEAVFPGEPAAGRRDRAHDRDLGVRLRVGRNMCSRVYEGVPVGLLGDDLALEQAEDHVERLRHTVALHVR